MQSDENKEPITQSASLQKSVVLPPSVRPQPKRIRRLGVGTWVALILMVVIVGTGAGFGGVFLAHQLGVLSTQKTASSSVDGNSVTTADEEMVATVAAKVGPSVVSILVSSTGGEVDGAGTGIIVSADGYIMTNNHVIEGAKSVSVALSDGTTYDDAEVIGSDPLNDIGFLKIANVQGLTAAEIGDSTSLRIGQRVVAIGNALGQYQNTVTSGIVSGTGRPVTAGLEDGSDTETLTDLIQTDAAINSGNSGGPLVNAAGQVIGINTAVAQDANGIGFAIPISATKGILAGVLKNGTIARPYLGVNYVSITASIADEYNLSAKEGAYVYNEEGTAVIGGGPAAKAGIQDKDIITKINDQTVGVQGSVASLVGQYQPGEKIRITVLRGSETKTVEAILGTYRD